jgi:hypothetical protein
VSATDDEDDTDEHDLTLDVMLGEPGGATFNTVVLGGTDIVVPLERDLDGDPYQDDEIWLESLDGSFREQRYSSDSDVVPDEDKNVLLYHFRHVPFGVYNIIAVVAARPIVVFTGMVVRKEGVFMGQDKLTEDYEGCAPSETEDDTADSADTTDALADLPGADEDEPMDVEDDDFDEED